MTTSPPGYPVRAFGRMKTASQLGRRDFHLFLHDTAQGAVADRWFKRRNSSINVRIVQDGEDGLDLFSFDQRGNLQWQAHFGGETPADVVLAAVSKACE